MEQVIDGLKFTPVDGETFVVLPSLDFQARLPLNEKLVLGSLFSGGRLILQLCYFPALISESDAMREESSLDGGIPVKRTTLGGAASLCWLSLPVDGHSMPRVESVKKLPELRMDDQINDLVRTRAYKLAIKELGKMRVGTRSASAWSRLRHGGARERALVFGLLLAKFGIAVVLAYSIIFLLAKTADLDARLYNLRLSQLAPTGVPAAIAQADHLAPDQLMVLIDLVRKTGISRFQDGDSFVMFSDPNCPACRAFEAKMASENWPFTPLIVPVAFQEGSREAVSGVLCAPDLGKAWEQAIAGQSQASCEKGSSQVNYNNDAFTALGLDSTPTFVSMSGSVFRGASDVQSLLAWARAHAPEGKIGHR